MHAVTYTVKVVKWKLCQINTSLPQQVTYTSNSVISDDMESSSDIGGYSPILSFFKWNFSYKHVAVDKISTNVTRCVVSQQHGIARL